MILSNSDIGTPFQIAFPDAINYIYKKTNNDSTWTKMNAGYADSAGYATSAGSATSATSANTATYATSAGSADSATKAGYITEGVYIDTSFASNFRGQVYGSSKDSSFLRPIRCESSGSYITAYGTGIGFGMGDTHGYFYMPYESAHAYIGAGNANKLNWLREIVLQGQKDGYCHVGSSEPSDSETKIWIQV